MEGGVQQYQTPFELRSCLQKADPEADGLDIYEAKEAFGSFVIAGSDTSGVLQFVEAALDQFPQGIQQMIDSDAHLAGFAQGDLGEDIPRRHVFPNAVSIIAPVGQQDAWLWQVVGHNPIKPEVVGCLPRRDLGPHRQPCFIDAEMNLVREATSRAAKTLPRSPPLAPAA